MKTLKNTEQDCKKRCIVYETWCMTCERREEERIKQETEDEEEQKIRIRKMRKYKYIGESARSAFERGLEHQRDLEELRKDSHMLKHYFNTHEGENIAEMEFGMKVLKTHRTAFNRQISESVEIQNQKQDHHILNSKSEYSRCALPRLTAKIGEESFKKMEQKKKEELEEEKQLEYKIRELRTIRSRERRDPLRQEDQPAGKKRRLNKLEYKRVLQGRKRAKRGRENPKRIKLMTYLNLNPRKFGNQVLTYRKMKQ